MGVSTAINGLLLALGPCFALYYALDLHKYNVNLPFLRAHVGFLLA